MAPSEPRPPDSTTTEPVDLTSTNSYSLHQAVRARRSEYIRPHRIRIKIGTWNVAASPGTDKDLASWFVDGKGLDLGLSSLITNNSAVETEDSGGRPDGGNDAVHLVGGSKIGLYVLGLQEVVDLNTASQYMTRVYASDPGPMGKWKAALQDALPEGYQLIVSEQLTGLLLLMFASPEVAATVSNVSTATVGTGLLGYLGNKGAIVTRIVLGETTRMVFVNCHLASGHEASYVDRRIWDVGQVLSRTQFTPVTFSGVSEDEGENIGEEDFAFWFGDLNFRLDGLPGDDIRRLLMLHTRGEYDLAKKGLPREDSLEGEGVVVQKNDDSSDDETIDLKLTSTQSTDRSDITIPLPDPDDFLPDPHDDPASLQATLDSLLPHDQLKRAIRERKVFHDGWREGPITFLPSYKYDVGTVGLFDSSEKRRAPSWCDRILYRTRRDKDTYDKKVEEEAQARKKDEEMKAQGMDHAADDDEVLFDYDPDNDGDEQPPLAGLQYDEYEDDEEGGEEVVTKEGFVDHIQLEIYTSHQRVTSSDHKPIDSIFTLDYDAVVPDLKAKVHAEVARELDRAENEGRPGITIVVDSQESGRSGDRQKSSEISVDLGEMRFLKKQVSTLTLANTGRVPATFSFVEKPSTEDFDAPSLPPWLTTSFIRSEAASSEEDPADLGKEVTLEPGETVLAQLEAFVGDIPQVRMLNDGQLSLEEVLVLRVTDGRDHFIPVKGTWSPTCIGRSIEELIRVPEGGIEIFAKSLSEKRGRSGSITYDLEVHSAAPRELFKLTEAVETLTDRALADEQMLEEHATPKDAGWPFEESTWKLADRETRNSLIVDLVGALDRDTSINEAFPLETSSVERLEVVGEVLLLFLHGLTDGIITTPLWNRIEQAGLTSVGNPAGGQNPLKDASEDDKTTILDILATAPNHNISFVFLTAMLAKTVGELSPLSKAEVETIKAGNIPRGGVLGRRSLSFRRGGTAQAAEALASLEKRRARERKYAEAFGRVVCRAPMPEKDKEKRALEDKQRAVVELFLRRRSDE